jgi:hypothetical protein
MCLMMYMKKRLINFQKKNLIDLTMAVIAINSYNRINIAFRTPAGDYVPGPTCRACKLKPPLFKCLFTLPCVIKGHSGGSERRKALCLASLIPCNCGIFFVHIELDQF